MCFAIVAEALDVPEHCKHNNIIAFFIVIEALKVLRPTQRPTLKFNAQPLPS